MRLLLTGGSGQVGEALRRLGPGLGVTVSAPGRDMLDLATPDTIHLPDDIDAVVSAGAYTAVDKAESEPGLAEAVNAVAPGMLAGEAAKRRVPIVHLSTDYVFDGTKTGAYVETDPVNPLSVYGRTKAAGERAVAAANPRHAILRTSWVYAAHGSNFVKTMLRLGRERDLLKVVDDQTGAPTSADDIARAAIAVLRGLGDGKPAGTYHYAAEGATTWHGLASAIWAKAGPRLGRAPRIDAIPTSGYPTPAKRPMNSRLDCAKIVATFAAVRRPWEQALDETLSRLLEDKS
ncbi:MAG: dTDP-4-dehydrorhamnose reductase [Alphaproteobacteria bacterium]|nr:dTDP-4-dehydrorhamnose reductase [Alphaproteobacteria bacterium]